MFYLRLVRGGVADDQVVTSGCGVLAEEIALQWTPPNLR